MMDDTNKILAVSYGNFSCRLEGFDDSVETMKAVVSYFHELAGHDRFMDMEPQAPDMDTLARLTQEQVGAPVEVTGEGQNVSLRLATAAASEDAAADEVDQSEDEIEVETADDGDTFVLNSPEDDITDADIADELSSDEVAPTDTVDEAEDGDSVAAKLQRIRAVVGRTAVPETLSGTDDDFAEDLSEAAVEDTPTQVNPLAQRLADLAKRNSERAAEEAGIVLNLDDDDDETSEEDDLAAEELDELDDELISEEALELDDDALNDADTNALEETAEDEGDDDLAEIDFEDAEMEADSNDDGPLVLTSASEIRPNSDDDDFYNKEEDHDLHKQVAEAQREIDETVEARSQRSDLRSTVDANMSRILSQTDERLNEPEGRRHRDAFAQLKAAVAATEAARQLGDPGAGSRDKNEVFRDDLDALEAEAESEIVDEINEDIAEDVQEAHAEVNAEAGLTDDVAETQPEDDLSDEIVEEAAEEASQNTAVAPAPLKLVSSQSVKAADKPLDAASARLREIAANKEAEVAAKGGFAEFAAQQGATELADLLEAAAAYIAFVEGENDFSRPQVMKKVQSTTAIVFSREDGLRSFGRLLRQSKVIKLNNGRFQVAEDTRFRPEDKAAQG